MSKPYLAPCTLRTANDFVAKHHRHNGRTARNGGKWAVSVMLDNVMVGVAIVGNPLSATLMDGWTAEVLRVCTIDEAPKGSRLGIAQKQETRPQGRNDKNQTRLAINVHGETSI